jgi:uncharacterized protein YndB with AHSA1/START domain
VSRTSIEVPASPDEVFDVLDDAYAYPRWVVGTRRIRHVDPDWPAVGTRFHHAVGTFVAELHDSTMVVQRARPQFVELEVRIRPAGVARVEITLTPASGATVVTLEETPAGGVIARCPRAIVDPVLHVRNVASLHRLRRLVEATARGAT